MILIRNRDFRYLILIVKERLIYSYWIMTSLVAQHRESFVSDTYNNNIEFLYSNQLYLVTKSRDRHVFIVDPSKIIDSYGLCIGSVLFSLINPYSESVTIKPLQRTTKIII